VAGKFVGIAVVSALLLFGLTACQSDAEPERTQLRSFTSPKFRYSAIEFASRGPDFTPPPRVSFRYPAQWNVRTPPKEFAPSRAVSVSTQAQRAMCSRKREGGISCGPPTVKRLRTNSVLLTIDWPPVELVCPSSEPIQKCGMSLEAPVARAGSGFAHRSTGSGAECSTRGTERSVFFTGYTYPPDAFTYNVLACIRGPNTKTLTRQVDALVRSLNFS